MRQNKLKTDRKKIADLISYFSDLIDKSNMSQTEIARMLSDDEKDYQQTYISLMRSGRTKIPVYLIPKLAGVLGVDKREFLMKALDAYHPEIHALIETYLSNDTNDAERQLLELWREAKISSGKRKLNQVESAKIEGFFAAL